MFDKVKKRLKRHLTTLPIQARFIKKIFYTFKFRNEIKLLRGTHKNINNDQSIIHFSFNKAATQYIKSIFKRIAESQGMTHAALNEYAFHSSLPYFSSLTKEDIQNNYAHVFRPRGYLYSVFGGMVEGIPAFEEFKVILITRDPRDIIVSDYYSIAYTHQIPDNIGDKYERFSDFRQKAQKMSIDEYAIDQCDRVLDIYQRYYDFLLNKHPSPYISSYEHMVYDFEGWLSGIINYCDFNVDSKLIKRLVEENMQMKPKKENIHKHLRKGLPGDYKNKLKPETINLLNKKFVLYLEKFNYSIE